MLQMALTTLGIANLTNLSSTAYILVRVINCLWCLSSIQGSALEVSLQILLVQRRNVHLKVLVRLTSVDIFLKLLPVLCEVSSLWRCWVSVEIGTSSTDLKFLLCLIFLVVRRAFRVIGNILLFLVSWAVNNAVWNTRWRRAFCFESLVACLGIIWWWELFGRFEEGLLAAIGWVRVGYWR